MAVAAARVSPREKRKVERGIQTVPRRGVRGRCAPLCVVKTLRAREIVFVGVVVVTAAVTASVVGTVRFLFLQTHPIPITYLVRFSMDHHRARLLPRCTLHGHALENASRAAVDGLHSVVFRFPSS